MFKEFLPYDKVRNNALKMAYRIHQDGFIPDVIYVSLRGGAYLANVISEYFKIVRREAHPVLYAAVVARSYSDIRQRDRVMVDGWTYSPEHLRHGDRILLVDDSAVLRRLASVTLTSIGLYEVDGMGRLAVNASLPGASLVGTLTGSVLSGTDQGIASLPPRVRMLSVRSFAKLARVRKRTAKQVSQTSPCLSCRLLLSPAGRCGAGHPDRADQVAAGASRPSVAVALLVAGAPARLSDRRTAA